MGMERRHILHPHKVPTAEHRRGPQGVPRASASPPQGVTIPNANAFKNYSKDSSQTRVLRNVASSHPKRSCGSKENTSQLAFFTASRIIK